MLFHSIRFPLVAGVFCQFDDCDLPIAILQRKSTRTLQLFWGMESVAAKNELLGNGPSPHEPHLWINRREWAKADKKLQIKIQQMMIKPPKGWFVGEHTSALQPWVAQAYLSTEVLKRHTAVQERRRRVEILRQRDFTDSQLPASESDFDFAASHSSEK